MICLFKSKRQNTDKNLQTLSKLRCMIVYVHNFDLSKDCRWNVLLIVESYALLNHVESRGASL